MGGSESQRHAGQRASGAVVMRIEDENPADEITDSPCLSSILTAAFVDLPERRAIAAKAATQSSGDARRERVAQKKRI